MLKKNDQLLNLVFLFFYLLRSNVIDNKYHKQKWRVLFFTRIKIVARVGMRVRMRLHASNEEDWDIANIYKSTCKSPKHALVERVSH